MNRTGQETVRAPLTAALPDAGLGCAVLDAETVLSTPLTPGEIHVVVFDRWTPGLARRVSAAAWSGGAILVPVRVDGRTCLVGPVLAPGAPACLGCVEVARLSTIGRRTPRHDPDLNLGGLIAPGGLPFLTALIAETVARMTAATGTMWVTDPAAGTVSAHRVRSRPGGCDLCGPVPDDSVATVGPPSTGPVIGDPLLLRAANPGTTLAGLRAELVDQRLGPVAHVSRREAYPIALVHAEVAGDWETRDGGYGRAVTYEHAERVALFEAVERMAGLGPRARRTNLRASFADLGPERALDPARLGLPDAHRTVAGRTGLAQRPARPEPAHDPRHTVMNWVHGWSMALGRPLAVPEQAVYWGLPTRSHEDRFLAESSNGCGVGNSLTEAALYGLLEVAERDAFLLMWYSRTPLDRVVVPVDDPLVAHLLDHIDALGHDLLLFDATNDFEVPVVVALALCRDRSAAAPQAFFAAGAHLDPRQAIRSAVVEAVVNLMISADFARDRPDLYDRNRLRRLLGQPELVVELDDHMALYTLPEALSRLDFLLVSGAPALPWAQLWPHRPPPQENLAAVFDSLAARACLAGMDVIVVDQTDPVVRDACGLYAAKVVVPGAIPLTFGHANRRTYGLNRLLDVPYRMGRLAVRPCYDDLVLDPHPFP